MKSFYKVALLTVVSCFFFSASIASATWPPPADVESGGEPDIGFFDPGYENDVVPDVSDMSEDELYAHFDGLKLNEPNTWTLEDIAVVLSVVRQWLMEDLEELDLEELDLKGKDPKTICAVSRLYLGAVLEASERADDATKKAIEEKVAELEQMAAEVEKRAAEQLAKE